MTEKKTYTWACLCGAVSVAAVLDKPTMGACHCGMCRKWTGGPLMAVECHDRVTWTGEDKIGVYDSSDWAQRGFCTTCGTHLFYRLKDRPFYALPAGLLDDMKTFIFDHQVFIDEKPTNYSFANATDNLTGAEVFAKAGA